MLTFYAPLLAVSFFLAQSLWLVRSSLFQFKTQQFQTSTFKLRGTPTSDGGFLIARDDYLTLTDNRLVASKVDSLGNQEWAWRLDDNTSKNQPRGVVQLPNGDYIALFNPQNANSQSMIVAGLFTAAGQVGWTVNIENYDKSILYRSAIPTQDGGVLICGQFWQPNTIYQALLIKLDSAGATQWMKQYGDSNGDQTIQSVIQLQSGDFLVCGFTDSFFSSEIGFIMRIQADGSQTWNYFIGTDAQQQRCRTAVQSSDGNYLYFTGTNGSGLGSTTGAQIFFGKLDLNGQLMWLKSYEGSPETNAADMIRTSDGNFLIEGVITSTGPKEVFLLLLDEDGNVLLSSMLSSSYFVQPSLALLTTGDIILNNLLIIDLSVAPPIQQIQISKLDATLNYCGEMETISFPVKVRDVTNHADLIYQQHVFTQFPTHEISTYFSSMDIEDYSQSTSLTHEEHCQVQSAPAIQQVSTLSPTDTDCGCYHSGVCDTVTGECTCFAPYIPPLCRYDATEYTTLSQQIEAEVLSLKNSITSTNHESILTELRGLTSSPDLVNTQTALIALSTLNLVISPQSTLLNYEKALNILSHISEVASHQASLTITPNFSQMLKTVILDSVGQTTSIISSQISISHVQLSAYQSDSPVVLQNADGQASVEIGASFNHNSNILSCALINKQIYNPISPSEKREASSILSVIIHKSGQIVKVSNLEIPIKLSFPIDKSITPLKSMVDDVYVRKTKTVKQIIQNQDIECLFFDQNSDSLIGDGCWVQSFSQTQIRCECTHLTDFMVFVRGSYEPLQQSNYYAFLALKDITWESLLINRGFRLSLILLGCFFVLIIMTELADRVISNRTQMTLLRSQIQELFGSSEQKYKVEYQREDSQKQNENQDEEVVQTRSPLQVPEQSHQTKKKTFIAQIWSKMSDDAQDTKKKYNRCCCCCCLCSRLIVNELSTNNQIYNLFVVNSRLVPRTLRLLFFFLGLIVDLAICALFYDLSEDEEETSSVFSAETLSENFWVGLYTVLFSLPLMLCVSLCFSSKASLFKDMVGLKRGEEIQEKFKHIRRQQRCKFMIGGIMFSVVYGFCSLFIIAFCELASESVQNQWMSSSLISMLIDMGIFQLAPALLVSCFGMMSFGCNLKCAFCFIVIIEGYRAIRNYVGFF